MPHPHHCPDCDLDWECNEAGPVWDQEDSDCRWYTVVRCPSCLQLAAVRDKAWKRLYDDAASILDIDAGIVALVALHAHNIVTRFSCQGHVDSGSCYPWVVIDDEIHPDDPLSSYAVLDNLLSEYEDHIDTYSDIAITMGSTGTLRLETRSAPILRFLPQEILTPVVRAQILQRCQREMDEFQYFLKKKFLQGDANGQTSR